MLSTIDLHLLKSVSLTTAGDVPLTFIAQGASVHSDSIQKGHLYIPLETETFDGHRFLEAAIEGGASAALWQQNKPIPETVPNTFPLFLVENTSKALHELSNMYLKEIDPIVICVTSSDGKRMTKDIVTSILTKQFHVHQTTEVLQGYEDISLAALNMSREADAFVFELPVETKVDIQLLKQIIVPNYLIITSNQNKESVRSQASEIDFAIEVESAMKASSVLILDGDEPLLRRDWRADPLYCGFHKDSLFHIDHVVKSQTEVNFTLSGVRMTFTLPLVSEPLVKNAVFAIALSVHLGVMPEKIAETLKEYREKVN
ncbi:Mur ligase family protein [Evansella halocellulosilytica]|uniref:Mur ligase family protein n=1 Tax=Evansella halocellulosilytica TaxID=2011013 RepID=UPI0015CD271C|nr:Mur ligase family protein [Evansella halocellulosilytica]